MAAKPTRAQLRQLADDFLAIETVGDLAELLKIDQLQLTALATKPNYHIFYVPKKNGEQRLIEDPEPPLKTLQRSLNRYLQAVYFFHKTEAAYGFVTNAADDFPHQQRHIVTHARLHLGADWLLNMDVEDFFHFVKTATEVVSC